MMTSDFLTYIETSCGFPPLDFVYPFEICQDLSCSNITLIISLAKLSDRGVFLQPCLYRLLECCLLRKKAYRPLPTFTNFSAQSLHLRFGSAAPCPTLRSYVTSSTPKTWYGRAAIPYPTGFSCCVLSAYKDCLRNQWKTVSPAFSARTLNTSV